MSDVLLKNVDPSTYAQLKAEAASQRKTIGEVFNEVVKSWLATKERKDLERERNVEAYLRIKERMLKHPSDYFVIAKGDYLGHFPTLSQAFRALKRNRVTKALVVRSQSQGEWLGGSFEG